jgi:F-type H+-transporting ATPase subunit delta
MNGRALARQYATALFDIARKIDLVDQIGRDVASFDRLLATHHELRTALTSQTVPPARKSAAIGALAAASDGVSDEVRRLLQFMAERNRLALFHDVAAAYAERAMEQDQVANATITTAAALDERERTALASALGKAIGRRVTLTERVDPSIVGGVIAKVGGTVFDGSITRQIERLKSRLLADA